MSYVWVLRCLLCSAKLHIIVCLLSLESGESSVTRAVTLSRTNELNRGHATQLTRTD